VQRSDGIEVDILPGEIDRIEGRLPFELNSCHSIFNIEDIRDVLQPHDGVRFEQTRAIYKKSGVSDSAPPLILRRFRPVVLETVPTVAGRPAYLTNESSPSKTITA
jgi:hypothetical protein